MLWARHRATGSPSWACFPGADPLKIPIDPNGNLATKTEGTDSWTYSWNAENQLTKVDKNGVEQARFAYDPKGRRVEKVTGGVAISYTYDHEDILREVRGASTVKYVYGFGFDEPLAADDGTALQHFHADVLGSVVKTTNAAGMVTLTRRYDAWGNLEIGAAEAGYAFTGREWDPEIGLYYYRARYYDPRIGRFLSEDPIGFDGGPNLYAYVWGNPVKFVDPEGLGAVAPRRADPCPPGATCMSPDPPPPQQCPKPCRKRFHWDVYLSCVGSTLVTGGPVIFASCLGAYKVGAFGAAGAYTCSFIPVWASREACRKLAWFCDEQGPGDYPDFTTAGDAEGPPPYMPRPPQQTTWPPVKR